MDMAITNLMGTDMDMVKDMVMTMDMEGITLRNIMEIMVMDIMMIIIIHTNNTAMEIRGATVETMEENTEDTDIMEEMEVRFPTQNICE
uniref:Candidate secreted effector n=1 Tax=Meloidogyne incognita TaxID=6306 RepID=A0A914KLP7_MELIC